MTKVVVDGRSLRRVENSARIFDAAMKLLETRSYAAISVEEICKAANVGRATFFRIFSTKADLLLEFNRRLAERVQKRLEQNEPQNLEQGLRLVGAEIAATWCQAPAGAAALAMEFTHATSTENLHEGHRALYEIVLRLIEGAITRGELGQTRSATLLASLALVQMTAPVGYWFRHPELDLAQLVGESVKHWLYGALEPSSRE